MAYGLKNLYVRNGAVRTHIEQENADHQAPMCAGSYWFRRPFRVKDQGNDLVDPQSFATARLSLEQGVPLFFGDIGGTLDCRDV